MKEKLRLANHFHAFTPGVVSSSVSCPPTIFLFCAPVSPAVASFLASASPTPRSASQSVVSAFMFVGPSAVNVSSLVSSV